MRSLLVAVVLLFSSLSAQPAPYDVFPSAEPPYHRVRYEASNEAGGLIFPVNYTIWIPPGVKTLRGVIVHQHGCGEGSCKSGLAGFIVERDGQPIARLPEQPKNPYGRPHFQGLQYSDTPAQPLVRMQYSDATAEAGGEHRYRVIAVNTVGLKSE